VRANRTPRAMASTPEGARLTEEHRQAQQDVRDGFLAEFIALWALLDTARLDDTGPGWINAVMRVIREYRELSAEVAMDYLAEFEQAEVPDLGTPVPDLSRPRTPPPPAGPATGRPPRQSPQRTPARRADGFQGRRPRGEDVIPDPSRRGRVRFEIDERALQRGQRPRARIEIPDIDWTERDRAAERSLIITGPIGQKSKIKRGQRPEQARDHSFVESSGAASTAVLTGGRQSLMRAVTDNMRLIGYIRVTAANPCYFCAMLASRGPVYTGPRAAGPNVRGPRNPRAGLAFVGEGGFKVHDHCMCTVEPVYNTDTIWPGRAREFQELWNEHIRGQYSGDDAIRAWRRFYDRWQREQRLVA
jgi:hypothetical protein